MRAVSFVCRQLPSTNPLLSLQHQYGSMQVVGEDVVPVDDPGLHAFLLSALLAPASLGVPSSEDEAARALISQAKVPCCKP